MVRAVRTQLPRHRVRELRGQDIIEPAAARGIAWHPSGQEVWFTASPDNAPKSLWAATRSGHVRALAHGPGAITLRDIAPDGRRLLVTNPDNGTVTVVDLVTRKALREIPVGEKPEGVTWIGKGPVAAATVYSA